MASFKNFSKKSRAKINGDYDNIDSSLSHDPKKIKKIDYTEWTKFLSYYRYYIDKYAVEILGMNNLFHFQRLLLRAMGRYPSAMILACRGLTKSYICAIFMVCMADLYPGIKIGIVSGNGNQARMVIKQKIEGELTAYENIRREILFPIKTSQDECIVNFKNGSSIRAISLGQSKNGDSVRGYRFQLILVDEARLVKSSIIKDVLEPMLSTPRPNNIEANKKYKKSSPETGRIIYISSAWLKTCDLYSRFLSYYHKMIEGDSGYFVASLDYKVGIDAGLWTEEYMDRKKNDPTITLDSWLYEYCGQFVGSSIDSYYPYEITIKCRTLYACELSQPKNSKYDYIITHDVAVSGKSGSDNACTHVIKLIPKGNGTFIKEVVFTKALNGATLREQKDWLRTLAHVNFPNTIKIVIDSQSAGEGLLSLFAEPWVYNDGKGNTTEFPPLICDDDDEARKLMPDAEPLIRGIKAYAEFNNTFYPYMKTCFEDGNIRLLVDSQEMDEDYKSGKYSAAEMAAHVEQDFLIQELSNIKQQFRQNGTLIYGRIVQKNKRDRATSLMYGLSLVYELERDEKANLYKKKTDDLSYLSKYIY